MFTIYKLVTYEGIGFFRIEDWYKYEVLKVGEQKERIV